MAESNGCIFCGIARGEISAKEVYRDEQVMAFHDVNPAAPIHVLVIPTRHVPSLQELDEPQLAAALLRAVPEVAERVGLHEKGYRMVVNTGSDAGQSVGHVHAHVLGGRALGWPPG